MRQTGETRAGWLLSSTLLCGALILAIIFVGAIIPLLLIACWPRAVQFRPWAFGLLAAICVFGGVHQWLYHTLAEDAFITFRYSHHLAIGDGPVFNPGERVEGYSNFLLMVMLAIAERFFQADVVTTARALGVVASLLAVVLTYRVCRQLPDGTSAMGLAAAALVAASGPFAAYGPSGMETPLLALGVIATLSSLIARRWLLAGVLIGLSTLTHLEGVLLLLPACVWAFTQGSLRRDQWLGIV